MRMEICSNMKKILLRMGYRKHKENYYKCIAFSIFVFKFSENETWTLSQFFIAANNEIMCWKNTPIESKEFETMTIQEWQYYEAVTGRDYFYMINTNSPLLVPELTTEDEMNFILGINI